MLRPAVRLEPFLGSHLHLQPESSRGRNEPGMIWRTSTAHVTDCELGITQHASPLSDHPGDDSGGRSRPRTRAASTRRTWHTIQTRRSSSTGRPAPALAIAGWHAMNHDALLSSARCLFVCLAEPNTSPELDVRSNCDWSVLLPFYSTVLSQSKELPAVPSRSGLL